MVKDAAAVGLAVLSIKLLTLLMNVGDSLFISDSSENYHC